MAGVRRARVPVSRWLLVTLLVALACPARAAIDVTIEGLEGEPLANVRAYLSLVRLAEERPDAAAAAVRRAHRRAPGEIRAALEPFGHYRAEVEAELRRAGEGWQATYRVHPGEPVRLETIDIGIEGAGADDPGLARARAGIDLAPGQPLHHARYEDAKRRLLEAALRRGYLDARWRTGELRIDPGAGTATVELALETGPRYRFGEVTVEQDILDDSFVRRYIRFRPGDPFDRDALLELEYALRDSVYFRNVNVEPRREAAEDLRIPVRVTAEPVPENRYTFGIGYGTDTGARTTASWEDRRVNRRGHRLRTELELAEIRTRVGLAYTIPLAEPWRERLVLSGEWREEEVGGGVSEGTEVGARRITVSGGWQRSLGLRYLHNRDTLDDESTVSRFLIPGVTLGRAHADDAVYARRAYRFSVGLEGASAELASDAGFAQARVNAGLVRALAPRTRVLLRGEAGHTWVDDITALPLSQRFYAGGDQSVRGFAYQSLGPTDADGDVIGGRSLVVASVELEQLVVGNWGAAVFTDAGNAYNESPPEPEVGAGAGLRWRSPVGVLKLDFARPVSTAGSWRLHLGLEVSL